MSVPYPYPGGGYPQQPVAPQYPVPQQPQYPVQPAPQYPAQQFPAPQQAPQQPQVPLATGTIDEFYGQPSTGGGPSISWKDKPVGTAYAGIIARDVTNADIQQQTNFNTKQPEFYRDGRPKFVMKVPLKVQPSQEFPEGEATLFVRGRMRDELVRAMSEAGASGSPKAGDGIVVQLSGKKQSGQGLNPANEFTIQYMPASAGGAGAPSPAPAPVVAQQPAPQAPVQPQMAIQQQVPAPAPQVPQTAPSVPQAPAAPAQQAPQFQPPAPAMPEGFSQEQQELLARLTGQPA